MQKLCDVFPIERHPLILISKFQVDMIVILKVSDCDVEIDVILRF